MGWLAAATVPTLTPPLTPGVVAFYHIQVSEQFVRRFKEKEEEGAERRALEKKRFKTNLHKTQSIRYETATIICSTTQRHRCFASTSQSSDPLPAAPSQKTQ